MTSAVRLTEKQIESGIIRSLRTLGFDVTKTSQPRASMVTLGIPDLYVRSDRYGVRCWMEVKTPKGKLSAYQTAWHQMEKRAGGDVVVVRSLDDVLTALRDRGVPIG